MTKPGVKELRDWRHAEGFRRKLGRALTYEEAAAGIVLGTKPVNRSTWCEWENGNKVPGPRAMPKLLALTGLSSDIFYGRPKPIEKPKAPIEQLSLV